MGCGSVYPRQRFLIWLLVILGIMWGAFTESVEANHFHIEGSENSGFDLFEGDEEYDTSGFFGNGGWEFTWPSWQTIHLPAAGRPILLEKGELGDTYIWQFEIVANEWYVSPPGFNFGVAVNPLPKNNDNMIPHELGQLALEWAYRGSDGQTYSNNIKTPWGRPFGEIGDQIRFVFDTASGSLWVYSKLVGEDEFMLEGDGPAFTDLPTPEVVEANGVIKGFHPMMSVACAMLCTVKVVQPEISLALTPTGTPFTSDPVNLFHTPKLDFPDTQDSEDFIPRLVIDRLTVTITNGKPGDKLIVFGDEIDAKHYDDETYKYVLTRPELDEVLEALGKIQFFNPEIDENEREIKVEFNYSHYIYRTNPETHFEKTITLAVEKPESPVHSFLIEAESGGPVGGNGPAPRFTSGWLPWMPKVRPFRISQERWM